MKFNYEWNLTDGYPAPGIDHHGSKVLSTFSCGGGSTMGYKLAGYDVIGCNDIDPRMMEVYKLNHNPKHSFLESITTFKDTDLPDEFYNLDLLDGSPPCSSFSMAGNREKDWGKEKKFKEGQSKQVLDTLFFDFIDLAKRLQPKVVVAENVKGLLLGEAIHYVRKIYDEFENAGYYVQHWLLDASKMGVPQRRERVFFIALRKDLAEPFMYQKDMFTRMPRLELVFNEEEIPFKDIRCESGNSDAIGLGEKISHYWKKTTPGNNFSENHPKGSYFNEVKASPIRPLPTIRASGLPYDYETERVLFNKEIQIAGTFPLNYKFINIKIGYLIGMSVPPVMTAQISHQIYLQWLSKLKT